MKNWQSIYENKQQLNRYPFTVVVSYCMKNFSRKSNEQKFALDVGSGSGVHCKFLADLGFNVIGIEGSEHAVQNANVLFPGNRIKYKCCTFDSFDGFGLEYDFVLDRLSTTHSSLDTTNEFYQKLRNHLVPGAKVLWQGFSWCNSARRLGIRKTDGSYDSFTGGILKDISPAVFYQQEDIEAIFKNYSIDNLTLTSDKNIATGYNHSLWTLEATYDR